MLTNDQVVLLDYLTQRRETEAPGTSESEYFELFTAGEILKDYDLSWDEIEAGIVGGGSDGGIDSVFLFVNGTLIQEDTDVSIFKSDVCIDLFLIQSKRTRGFSEDSIQKLQASSKDLLDLTEGFGDFTEGLQ